MAIRGVFCVGLMLASVSAWAIGLVEPVEPELGRVAQHQALLDVGTDLRLMCVATHPDDEDGATLTYYRKKYGYKTFALIATRGEGGQNEIGSELYEELGVIRTDEMARASAHTGADLHFLDYPEFGYSKNAEETFAIWGQEETLRRMVRKIRELRPDVIITHHGETGGHGHHQAVGRALVQSFDLAADPNAFPEQIEEGLEPWQPARLYHRSFGGGGAGVIIPFSELDPARGLTYAQIAANALGEHETQGMGFFIDRFLTSRSSATYRLVKETSDGTQGGGSIPAPSGELFDGLKDRVSAVARALSEKTLADVTKDEAYTLVSKESDPNAKARANRLAKALSELRLTTNVSDSHVVPGQTFTVAAEVVDYGARDTQGAVELHLENKSWFRIGDVQPVSVDWDSNGFAQAVFSVKVSDDVEPNVPQAEYLFEPHFLEPQMTVMAKAKTDGATVELRSDVLVDVAPAVTVDFLEAPYLIAPGDTEATLSLLVTNNTNESAEVSLSLESSNGITLSNSSFAVSLSKEDEQKLVTVPATIANNITPGDYAITASIAASDYQETGTARVVDVVIPEGKKVGVIYSYDDTFIDTLERMRIDHESLEVDDFTARKLDEFSTIIVDIRAYLVRPDLVANNQTMLDYVKRGGTMLVMYQKTFEWNPSFAPYPLSLSRNRVTVEDAPIKLLEPAHPLFTTPNKMGDADWDGWRQERGLYFPSRWDDAYTPLIDVRDPGESPPPGSLLVADYGEGKYVYTALGWYRQLRELHPGTVRIFANMLAL